MRNISAIKVAGNIKTHIACSIIFFFWNVPFDR